MSLHEKNQHLVISLAEALNRHDEPAARKLLAENMYFTGVIGPSLEGADAYLSAMLRLGGQQKILKCFADEKDVSCFYELTIPAKPDLVLFGCGWFSIENERITRIRVVFDPTSLMGSKKNTQ